MDEGSVGEFIVCFVWKSLPHAHTLQAVCHYLARSANLSGASSNWNLKKNIAENRTPFLQLSFQIVQYSSYPPGTILSGIEMPSPTNLPYVFEEIVISSIKRQKLTGEASKQVMPEMGIFPKWRFISLAAVMGIRTTLDSTSYTPIYTILYENINFF